MKALILILPMLIGFIIDIFLGDPYSLPHPVRLMGTLISRLEGFERKRFKNLRIGGIFLAVTVIILSVGIPFFCLFFAYKINTAVGIVIESVRPIKENDRSKACRRVKLDLTHLQTGV